MERFRNFILGFASPSFCLQLFPPNYEVFTKLMDGCILLVFSSVSGILVSVVSSVIIARFKEKKAFRKK